MFIGVIVSSFAYVFQSTDSVLNFITHRGERVFKEAWRQCANSNTGLLERKDLAQFLAVRAIPESLFDRLTPLRIETRWHLGSTRLSIQLF